MDQINFDKNMLKENRKKDNKDLGIMQQGLNVTIFPKVLSVASSRKS